MAPKQPPKAFKTGPEEDPLSRLLNKKIPIKYGLIAGLILVVLFVIYDMTGWASERDFRGLVPYLLFMVVVVISQFSFYKALPEESSFKNLFALGFRTTAVATSIYILFLIIFILVVPSYKANIMELTQQGFIDQKMDPDLIDTNMKKFQDHFLSYSVGSYIFRMMIQGLIAAVIGALAITQYKKIDPKN